MIMAVLEGIAMCFVLLIICVVGIADGPVGMIFFYEKEVQDKAIEQGLTTRERIFIDWYWVGKTKAWIIPDTEDMMPYIYGKTLIGKWVSTLIGYPVLAVIIAWVISKL